MNAAKVRNQVSTVRRMLVDSLIDIGRQRKEWSRTTVLVLSVEQRKGLLSHRYDAHNALTSVDDVQPIASEYPVYFLLGVLFIRRFRQFNRLLWS